jgi:hypothetical protein
MSQSLKGRYEGRVVVEMLDEGRVVSLVEALAYVDRLNQRWDVPSGARVDGASIPQALWSILGGPFEGKYRNASIIHDWFCDRRTRPWQRVHEIFYEAMLTSGVSELKARILYTGVRFGGPRWSLTAVSNNNLPDANVPPPARMAAPGPSHGGNVSFAGPSKTAKPGKNTIAGTKSAPVKRSPAKKPTAYHYEIKDADLKVIEEMARNELDLSKIDKMVESELKSRKRR